VTALAPVVVSAPEAVTVDAGEDAVFAVEATGDPEPDVQWQVSTDGQGWTDVAGATGWSLVLQDVSADDHGLLVRAVLANEGGTVATDGVALSVVSPPATSPVTAVPVAAARAVVGALPRTGTEPVGIAVVGGLMVLGGGLITVAARRRVTAR
jgi:LPXTG-motif cell wall-anchored protein